MIYILGHNTATIFFYNHLCLSVCLCGEKKTESNIIKNVFFRFYNVWLFYLTNNTTASC